MLEARGYMILPPTGEALAELDELMPGTKTKRIIQKDTFEFISWENYDMSMLMDSVVDACCTEGCVTEPDGHCEHGNPSVLIANGLM